MSETEEHSKKRTIELPAWVAYLLIPGGLMGIGGGMGTMATTSSVNSSVTSLEARLAGKLDLLQAKIDSQTAENARIVARQDKLMDRVQNLELENARRATGR